MTYLKNFIVRKKLSLLLIIGILIVAISTFLVTYAFFGPKDPDPALSQININASRLGSLELIPGDILVFGEKKILGSTEPSVLLKASSGGNTLSVMYDVYLEVVENNLIYTTKEEKAELLFRVYDETNTEITVIPGLEYVTTEEDYKGFNITDLNSKVPLKINVPIETNDSDVGVTHTWRFEVQYIDLLNDQVENNNAIFKANIIFEGIEEEKIITDKILSDNGGQLIVDSKDIRNYRLSSTSKSYYNTLLPTQQIYYEEDPGLYLYEENSNKNYIFRGAAENNWVYFAGYYWRIIKINEDNSVKMIYSGEVAPTIADSIVKSTDLNAGLTMYSDNITLAEYTGFMYEEGVAKSNTNNSIIKTALDNWYQTNLLLYEKYIADTPYCNNREINTNNVNGITGLGTGIGDILTNFGSTSFIDSNNYNSNGRMTFECEKEDAFTTADEVNGNGSSTYPIGLITSYEVLAAGLNTISTNDYNYLSSDVSYYTMSPYSGGTTNEIFIVSDTGMLSKSLSNAELALRPVISLKSDIVVNGTGYYNEPYIIVED